MSSGDNIRSFFENELRLGTDRGPQSIGNSADLADSSLLERASFVRSAYLKLEIAALQENENPYTDWATLGAGLVDILGMLANQEPDNSLLTLPDHKIIETFQQRIKNLEKFRQLFFDLYGQLQLRDTETQEIISPDLFTDRSNLDGLLLTIKEDITDQTALVRQLDDEIKEFANNGVDDQTYIVKQQEHISSLEQKQIVSIDTVKNIENEIESLLNDNNRLRDENKNLLNNQDESSTKSQDIDDAETKKEKINSLESELAQTTEMVFGFMKSCADLGAILLFITECSESNSIDEVVEKLFSLTDTMNLEAALLVNNKKTPLFFRSSENLKINIDSKIWSLKSESRLTEHGNIYLLHGHKAILCVNTATIEDADARDRARDNMQTLSQTLDSVIAMIDAKIALKNETERFRILIKTTKGTMDTINENNMDHIEQIKIQSEKLLLDCKEAFQQASIDTKAKKELLKIITASSNQILEQTTSALKKDSDFEMLIERLNQSQ
ncbi:MAG: hypothetical protein JKY67_15440 [Pseudomonadales bacterium]|nr:hypothetical protein [Pseudomonadales bacterium]